MSLSKLHIRFIQSQKNFLVKTGEKDTAISFPITSLYVKDMQNFYLIIKNEVLHSSDTMQLVFNEKTPALNSLNCEVSTHTLTPQSEEYEDALLFFNTDPSKVSQVILLKVQGLSDN